jgi:hypothetical protein
MNSLHMGSTKRARWSASGMNALAAIATAVILSGAIARSQAPEDQAAISRLGPDGFAALPPTLEILVDGSDAAVVGRILGTGGITLREIDNPYSEKKSLFGYAGYRVAIDDVLFTRNPGGAASLVSGTEIDLDQEVGREAARRFADRKTPVTAGDTCLLFLFARPHGWTILGWHAQFRRSVGPVALAENLGNASFAAAVTPRWLGASVRTLPAQSGVGVDWGSLLSEVRRLGARPPRLRPR